MSEPADSFEARLTADIAATAEHPDPADLTEDERRHLGLPDPETEEQ